MSQAIAQSATQLTQSTPTEIDLDALVKKNAIKAVTGVTRERITLNNSKLMEACRLEYKLRREITGRLSEEENTKLQEAVNRFVEDQLHRVHRGNSLSMRVYPVLDFANHAIVERVNAVGQNILTLEQQHADCTRMLRVSNEKLETYRKGDMSGNAHKDYSELIKSVTAYITKLEFVKIKITEAIQQIKKVS